MRSLAHAIRRGSLPHLLFIAAALATGSYLYQETRDLRSLAASVFSDAEAHGSYRSDIGSVRFADHETRDMVEEMRAASASFERDYARIDRSRLPVLVGSVQALGIDAQQDLGRAYLIPTRSAHRIERVIIAVRPDLIDLTFNDMEDTGTDASEERADTASETELERVRHGEMMALLAHEFAHIRDVATSGGKWTALCRDPLPFQADRDACVIQRENLYRRELGLPEDWTYGRTSDRKAIERYRALGARVASPGPSPED